MKARVMISSVTRDKIPVGQIDRLGPVWHEGAALGERLKNHEGMRELPREVSFSFARQEIAHHLSEKYGFDTYIFEEEGGGGASPQEEVTAEAESAQLVIALYGS